VTTDLAPGEHKPPRPPISSTLICGLRDAVVVDNATHGHGDHFFGASVLLDRFPKACFVAAPIGKRDSQNFATNSGRFAPQQIVELRRIVAIESEV